MITWVKEYDTGVSGIRDLDLCWPLNNGDGNFVAFFSDTLIPVQRHFKSCTLEVCEAWMIDQTRRRGDLLSISMA